jgi:hypothetical protein
MDDENKMDPTSDDKVRKALDDAADAAQKPHDDDAERRRRQENADEAGSSPRRGA